MDDKTVAHLVVSGCFLIAAVIWLSGLIDDPLGIAGFMLACAAIANFGIAMTR